MSHKHINVRLEGPALATAQDIHAAVERFNELQEALQEEYQKRLQGLQDETQKELKALLPQLHLAAGVPVGEVGGVEAGRQLSGGPRRGLPEQVLR